MPPYDPHLHHRRSIRLKDYDYSQPGAYFITICTRHGALLFGEAAQDETHFSDVGRMVYAAWTAIPSTYPPADIDVFVVMPNHVHGIIVLSDATCSPTVGAGAPACPRLDMPGGASLSALDIVGRIKSFTTARYWELLRAAGRSSYHVTLWHRNYYEHVIRNEEELARIREYITNNPLQWSLDMENPDRTGKNPTEEWLRGKKRQYCVRDQGRHPPLPRLRRTGGDLPLQ